MSQHPVSLSLQLDPVQNALAIFVPVGIFNRAEFPLEENTLERSVTAL